MTSRHSTWHERVALRVVECLADPSGHSDAVEQILRAIVEESGIRSAGIRLRENGDYPFYVVRGNAEAFVREERSLLSCGADGETARDAGGRPVLACLCGAVLTGKTGFAPGCQLASGSFFAGNLQDQARSLDTRDLPFFRGRCVADGVETLALINLRHGGEVIGLLHLSDPRPNILDSEDVELLERLGASIGAALGRRRAEDTLRKDAERTSALLQLHERAPALSDDDLYALALDLAVRLSDSEIGFLHVVSEDAKSIVKATWNAAALQGCKAVFESHHAMERAGGWADCLRQRRPIIYNDFAASPNQDGLPEGHVPVRRVMCIPVYCGERPRIIFAVGNKAVPYVERDQVSVQLVARELQEVVERREGRARIAEREQFYRAMFEKNRAIKLLIDPGSGVIVDANEAACEYYGYSRKQMLSMRITDINMLSPDEVRAEMDLAASEKRKTFYFRHRLASGEVRDVEVYSGPVETGGATYLYSIILDITARRRAEAALANSAWALRERYKELTCLYAVSKLSEKPGLTLEAFLEGVAQLLPPAYQYPDDASARIEHDGREYLTPGFQETETRQTAPLVVNGVESGRIEVGYSARRSADGDGLFLAEELFLIQAVAERVGQTIGLKRADAALQSHVALLRAITDGTTDAIYVKDRQGRHLLANAASCRLVGKPAEEVLGKDDTEIFAPDEARLILEQDRAVMESGTTRTLEETLTLAGARRVFLTTKGPVRDDQGAVIGLFGIARDITERKQTEEERARLMEHLNHAQKMEAIGTLAGGVAHDFNNILAGVLSGLFVLEMDLGSAAGDHREALDDMKGLVQRGAELARQLLGFSRRGKYDVRPLDLAVVVRKTSAMFGRTRRDVTILSDFADDLKPVLMDYAQLEQVLLNLFLNAGQAMPGGGRILLRAENATLTSEQTEVHGAAPGRFVKLVVADTGVGMDSSTRSRIFEPFFTTKAPGHGSGLGLASVYGIVKNHGGMIEVESEPGEGTTFVIFLPATDLPVVEIAKEAVAYVSGQGTILVVDDEPELLKLCAKLLSSMGYEVLTAEGGRAAVELMREHHARVSLVILDLTMPDMSGAGTYDAIREIAPNVKVLLASGYSEDGQARELLARGCAGFLQKPFTIAELSEKLREIH